ncbi:thiolase family protein [Geodermatophilus sabuli]|uniref:Acetyl-CoA acetyltransferase n=1 Tax=Geodermatophilus sabuli TaxID=1564158 RepID=A0A285EAI5_9ACTN|nr:thiolase family protein [Geodermatophilus sabuli]MBB3085523.1 acetyl-CoA acetyltransferase [Geodermatophilus sabuli]SNX96055.1 Acetyl-CoA acetyltransferase [Geodermatophilus sabuli]
MALDACIVGVGTSRAVGLDLGRTPLGLQSEAFQAALDDAGLDKGAVDGIVTARGAPYGVDYDEFVIAAGLDVRWVSQLWSHGRWTASAVAQAALAVSGGVADCVAVANAHVSERGYGRHFAAINNRLDESFRDGGGPYGGWSVHGSPGAGTGAAMVAQQYLDHYGASAADLAAVAVGHRRHAARNPLALLRDTPLTTEEYLVEPPVMGPLRVPDICTMMDGATTLLVTTSERAADLDVPFVRIAGIEGIHASRDNYVFFSRPGLGSGVSPVYDYVAPPTSPVYGMAGISRDDIDALYLYDPFAHMVWMALERWGFCGPGEAAALVRERGMDIDSPLPINTNGGLLAEGHLFGYGHIIEMTRQLRGAAGDRQVDGAAALQWANGWGDSLILTNERV